MGLTIHYEFQVSGDDPVLARKLVEKLRQRALQLPFANVGEIQILNGEECLFQFDRDKLRFMAAMNLHDPNLFIQPTEIIAFDAQPGNGCESAWFGLRLHEGLYSWQSFCKTGAFALDCLRCHLNVIKTLDYAAELDMLRMVRDDGGYWEDRDWRELLRRNGGELPLPREKAVAKQIGAWFGRAKKPINWKQYAYVED